MDYYIKSSSLERVDVPIFFISLITEENDGTQKSIDFAATQEELQHLVNKIRDAAKQLERVAE